MPCMSHRCDGLEVPAEWFPAVLGLPFQESPRRNGGPDVGVVLEVGLDAGILV